MHAYFVHDDLSVDDDEEGEEERSTNRNRFVEQLTLEENLKTTTTVTGEPTAVFWSHLW